jgi:hypothetical protein
MKEIQDDFRTTKPTEKLLKVFYQYQDEVDSEQTLNTISEDITNDDLIELFKEAIKTGKKIKL